MNATPIRLLLLDDHLAFRQPLAFMLEREFQSALPENMYVYPVDDSAELPPEWAKFAKPSPKPFAVDPDDVAAHRTEWLREWREIATR